MEVGIFSLERGSQLGPPWYSHYADLCLVLLETIQLLRQKKVEHFLTGTPSSGDVYDQLAAPCAADQLGGGPIFCNYQERQKPDAEDILDEKELQLQ